jgi:dolichyl-phosphate-mannose--protein O-mannosyl transferase
VIYHLVRNFGGSIRAGILAALLFICDGLNLEESRLILIDSQLIFWCGATLLVAQYWWAANARHTEAVRRAWESTHTRPLGYMEQLTLKAVTGKPSEEKSLQVLARTEGFMPWRIRLAYVLTMGLVCANCVSIKFTGLATPGMIALESFFALFFIPRAMPLPDLFGILGVVGCIFSFYYRIHFALLPNTGDGDAFMPIEFQRTLVNNTHYDPNAIAPGFWPTMAELNREMVSASARIEQRHHWDSVWWEWPLNLRGILYYSQEAGSGYSELVYLLGNPTVIWPTFGMLVLAVASLALWGRYRTFPEMRLHAPFAKFFAVIGYCLIVYVLNLLPYVWVTRSCFIYHYMPALFYAHIIAALLTDKLAGARWMPVALQVWAAVIVSGYLFYAPWVYSFPLTPEGHARRRWLPRWD